MIRMFGPKPYSITDPGTGSAQCDRTLNSEECAILDAHLARHPDAWLRVYTGFGSEWDFDVSFLEHLPSLRHLHLEAGAGRLVDLAVLAPVTDGLRSLSIDTVARFSDKRLDKPKQNTGVLGRFRRLERLQICGLLRDLAFLDGLPDLASLSLWRNKLRSLDGIGGLRRLASLDVHFNPSVSLRPVNECANLTALEVWDARGADGEVLQHAGLARAWFVSCGRDFRIADGAGFPSLRVCVLHSSKGPENVRRLAAAPRLACLVLSGTPDRLVYEDFAPLFGHPSLREVRADRVDASAFARVGTEQRWKVDTAPNFPADEYLA